MNRYVFSACLTTFLALAGVRAGAQPGGEANRIPNGEFQEAGPGGLPTGWVAGQPRASLAPEFRLVRASGRQVLRVSGGGKSDSVGWIATRTRIDLGQTYWFRVRFRKSDALNPLHDLRFEVSAGGDSQGIGEFHRLADGGVEGETRVCFPGTGTADAEVRLNVRLRAGAEAWIERVSLTETSPVPPRWVRVGCTEGPARLEDYGLKVFAEALDAAGREKTDLMLLPEYVNGEGTTETLSGPSARLMSEKARQYGMYVAGTIGRYDPATDRLYNSALLFDREGTLMGWYDKIHLYGPELYRQGMTPGDRVPVFQTDFGTVGFMTCYDSWFPDVAELAALRGAEILLFPNLGYDRGLMHTRSLDNHITLVTSTRSGRYGVWDALGRDVLETASQQAESATVKNVLRTEVGTLGVLIATLNLNAPAHQERSGGQRRPVLRSGRHMSNQRIWLEEEIEREKQRWWTKPRLEEPRGNTD